MKMIKRKLIWISAVFMVGMAFLVLGVIQNESALIGMGSGFMVVSILKGFQYFMIGKNSEKLKKYEMLQNEERLVFISSKSSSLMFYVILIAEYAAMVGFAVMGKFDFASIICYIAALQVVGYLVCYKIFSMKY